jgi:hypothetical protein
MGGCVALALALTTVGATARHRTPPAPSPAQRMLSVADARAFELSSSVHWVGSIPAQAGPALGTDVIGFTPDRLLVTSVNGDRLTPTGAEPVAGVLELLAPGYAPMAVTTPFSEVPLEPRTADADDHTVAWIETPSDDSAGQPWRLLAHNRDDNTTRVVARSTDLPFSVESRPAAGPWLQGDRVYWLMNEGGVYSRDLAALGPIRRELNDVDGVGRSGDLLCYGVRDAGGGVVVHRRNLSSGADTVATRVALGAGEAFSGLACDGGWLAWVIDGAGDDLQRRVSRLVARDVDGATTTIAGGHFGTPVMTPATLVWANSDNGQIWVYDRYRGVVESLGGPDAAGRFVASGPHLAWRTATDWQLADVTRE